FLYLNILFPSRHLSASVFALVSPALYGEHIDTALPLVLTGTAAGTLMSLGLNGSTFGMFPMLVLAIAAIVRDLGLFLPGTVRLAPATGAVLALFLTASGAAYTLTNARLLFVDANAPGPIV